MSHVPKLMSLTGRGLWDCHDWFSLKMISPNMIGLLSARRKRGMAVG